jgi:hypothetical protein
MDTYNQPQRYALDGVTYGSLPEALLDLADAAHTARRAGHSEQEIARAAGFPDLLHPARINGGASQGGAHVETPSPGAVHPARR